MSWDDVLRQADAGDGIDLTGMPTKAIEELFSHLDEAELSRIAKDLDEAAASARTRRELVARTLDVLSTVGGISLRLLRG